MLSLIVESRQKGSPKFLRKNNYLPGVVYGKEIKGLPIKVGYQDFEKIYKKAGESTIITLKVKTEEKQKEFPVLIREVQKDPLSENPLHVDFYQLPMNEEIEVTIPLNFKGEALAEKELGGILIKNIHEIDVKALPQNLIHSIDIDISSLKTFEDTIKIKDLPVPPGIKVLADPEEIVALVGRVEEEKIEAAPSEEKPEEVEVIKEKKEESEEEKED
jgi:large subunit ribosomal protein L25